MTAILGRPMVLAVVGAIVAPLSSGTYCLGAQAVKVFNPSFEMPVVTDPSGIAAAPSAAAQAAGPGDSPWVFSAGSGIAAKGAVFNSQSSVPSTVPAPPDGNQWAYLEPGQESGSQVLTFPAAGQYTLTFDAVLSPNIAVWMDNSLIALTLGASSSSSYFAVSGSFDVSARGHTLTFDGPVELLGPEPQPPSLIDAVAVVPEPTWCALLLPLMLLRPRRPTQSAMRIIEPNRRNDEKAHDDCRGRGTGALGRGRPRGFPLPDEAHADHFGNVRRG